MAKRKGLLKFEHKKEPVLPFSDFLLRLLRYGLFGCLLIGISVLMGVAGYSYFGKLGFVDSFHMASMILTGMGPVVEMKTNAAKLFSSFYALYSGVIFLSIASVFMAPVIHRLLHRLQVERGDEER